MQHYNYDRTLKVYSVLLKPIYHGKLMLPRWDPNWQSIAQQAQPLPTRPC